MKTLNVDEERFPARATSHYINGNKEKKGLRAADAEAG